MRTTEYFMSVRDASSGSYIVMNLLNGIVASVPYSEKQVLKKIDFTSSRFQNEDSIGYCDESASLIITVTGACNFSCSYCYYHAANWEKKSHHISIEGFSNWFRNHFLLAFSNLTSLYIEFIGGEPLLEIKIIDQLAQIIIESCRTECKIQFNIITNGYYLNEKNICELSHIKNLSAQVTIDGYRSDHNRSRNMLEVYNTFDIIIDNIVSAQRYFPISVRINFSRETSVEDMKLLVDFLASRNISSYYFSPITQTCFDAQDKQVMSDDEILTFYRTIWKHMRSQNYTIADALPFGCSVCIAKNAKGVVIDSDCNLYDCPSFCGIVEKQYGNWSQILQRKRCKDEECVKCKFYPVCLGGCTYQAYVNSIGKYCKKEFLEKIFSEFLLAKYGKEY